MSTFILYIRRKVWLQEESHHPDQQGNCRCRGGVCLHHEEPWPRHDHGRDHQWILPPTQEFPCWRDRHLPQHPHCPFRHYLRAWMGRSWHCPSPTRPSRWCPWVCQDRLKQALCGSEVNHDPNKAGWGVFQHFCFGSQMVSRFRI